MKTQLRLAAFLTLLFATSVATATVLKCSFSFGRDLIGTLALSLPDESKRSLLSAQLFDESQKHELGTIAGIGDAEYAVLKERVPSRRKVVLTQLSPLQGFFVELDRVVTIRLDSEGGAMRLRLYDPWFSKDVVAIGQCE